MCHTSWLGVLPTEIDAAMIEAGFRQRTVTVPHTVEGLAKAAVCYLTPEQRDELIASMRQKLK